VVPVLVVVGLELALTHGASVQWLHRMTPNSRDVAGNSPFSTYFTHVWELPDGDLVFRLARHRARMAPDAGALIYREPVPHPITTPPASPGR
jgi:hypothetical protein